MPGRGTPKVHILLVDLSVFPKCGYRTFFNIGVDIPESAILEGGGIDSGVSMQKESLTRSQ